MNICVLTHTFPRFDEDTAAPFMRGVAEGLASSGNRVFVLTPYSTLYKKNETNTWLGENNKYFLKTYKYVYPNLLHKLGYSGSLTNDMSLKPLMYVLSPLMILFATIALFKLVRKEHIDVINAHWILPNGFIACIVGRLSGVPVVSTLPGSDVYMASKNFLFRWMAKYASKNSIAITSNSPQLLKDLKKIGADDKKFITIFYGVDPDKFKPLISEVKNLRSNINILPSDIVVLAVGRLVAKKGFKFLIESIPEVLKKVKNLKVIIVGEGDQRGELENLVKKHKLEGVINLTGKIDYNNLANYYNLADIFILPSVRDEKGNLDDQSVAVMEAMACGKPVITTNFPGYQGVISQAENGFLVKEGDKQEIVQAIIKISSSSILQKKMGQKSRELVLKNFSWQVIGGHYTKLFNKVLSKELSYSNWNPEILDEPDRIKIGSQLLGVIKNQLNRLSNLSCLDIGCSGGTITNLLSNSFNKVVGVDIDEYAIKQAVSKYHKTNLKFILILSEKLPFKSNSFDIVVCNQTYEFVNNQNVLSREIYRVLRRGGICILGARNKFSIVEGQTDIPLIHFLPTNIAKFIANIFGKNYYPAKYLDIQELKALFNKFQLIDLTAEIIKEPRKYGFSSLIKYEALTRLLPLGLVRSLSFLSPNFIIICKKV